MLTYIESQSGLVSFQSLLEQLSLNHLHSSYTIRPYKVANGDKFVFKQQHRPNLSIMSSIETNTEHKSNGSCFQMKISSILVLLLATLACSARAEHALSEVWSEADGLQLKYSTDHDDLLSTKGSELSLASQKSDQAQPGQEAAGSGQESEESAANQSQQQDDTAEGEPSASGQTDKQSATDEAESDANETEQGTDSSSRQSEKVPLADRQVTSGAGRKFSEPAARFRSAARGSDDNDRQSITSRLRSSSDAIRFSSALDMADQIAGEIASADIGPEQQDRSSSEGINEQRSRFRAPGGVIDERSHPGPNEETSNAISDDDQVGPGEGEARLPISMRRTSRPQASRGRQGMIEFDRIATAQPAISSKPDQSSADIPEPVITNESDDTDRDSNAARDQTGVDEDARPPKATGSKVSVDESEDAGGEDDASAAASATKHQKQPERSQKPAYFRQNPVSQARPESPDSVRDDFISPGHFPGSMAHLTQAASELKQVGAATSKPQSEQQAASLPVPIAVSAPPRVEVTPEPESQPESQQIMAPLLLSTTTMAPMPSTSSTPEPPNGNSTDPTAPMLKRFKFRKYR